MPTKRTTFWFPPGWSERVPSSVPTKLRNRFPSWSSFVRNSNVQSESDTRRTWLSVLASRIRLQGRMRVHDRIACDAPRTKRLDERKEAHGRQWRSRSKRNPDDERDATRGAKYLRGQSDPVP